MPTAPNSTSRPAFATGFCVLGPCLGERLQAIPHLLSADGALHLT